MPVRTVVFLRPTSTTRVVDALAIDCTTFRTTNAMFVFTRRVPGGVTTQSQWPAVACASSVTVAVLECHWRASFEELWDVAAVLEALHNRALWRFPDHLRRDQPMEYCKGRAQSDYRIRDGKRSDRGGKRPDKENSSEDDQ